MPSYYVDKNTQESGEHEVHASGCDRLPELQNRMYLGTYEGCREAVREARKLYLHVDGCYHCARECHTGCVQRAVSGGHA